MAVTRGLTGDKRFADRVLELQVEPDTETGCEVLVGQLAYARVTGVAMPLPAAERRERMTKDEFDLWWLQLILGIVEILLAFWVSGSFRTSAIFLVAYVGIIALSRGITELFVAFKLRGLRKRLATV